jgi:protein-disulfide isomerase
MDRRLFIGASALAGAAALGLSLAGPGLADTPVTGLEPGDMTLGSPTARVTVIEYASASCPHCARFNNEVFPAFKAKYIDTGRVFYIFREFLTSPVEMAAASFLIARCAGKDKYFSVVDAVFRAQAEIYATQDFKSHILKIAAAAGLDEKAVNACIDDPAAQKALNERMQRYLTRDGIRSTPTFVIAGQTLEGEQTIEALDAAITAAEAKAAATPPASSAKPAKPAAHRRKPHG